MVSVAFGSDAGCVQIHAVDKTSYGGMSHLRVDYFQASSKFSLAHMLLHLSYIKKYLLNNLITAVL